MDMPLISVVVPVYKVEKYLDRCVQSIVDQTYRRLEIILVDDGSPDNCGAMCDVWAEKDSRIKVIHKANGGLSDARNAGMAVASGVYMGFVDSDDYISSDMYQLLYDRMIADDADIAACGVEMIFEDGTVPRRLTPSGNCVLNKTEAMEAVIRESWLKQPVWYKLYKTELIRDCLFPVGKYHEDVFWTWQAVARAEKVGVFDTPCYCYVQRSGSIMGEGYSLKRLDALEAKAERLEYIQIHFPALLGQAKQNLWFSCMYALQMIKKECFTEDVAVAEIIIKSILHRHPVQLRYADSKSFKQLMWLSMAKISFGLTCMLRMTLGIGV